MVEVSGGGDESGVSGHRSTAVRRLSAACFESSSCPARACKSSG